ncbi:malonyl-[acyl-carrier protein] O-methyltransferase BioC, partial [Pseudoalteromonas sp. S3260]|uniref:methyltransferase domain-containing protein n=1 Tax=Pseudoalteromonas sp. S3260 TaxID=579534 RepID=UPI00110BA9A9
YLTLAQAQHAMATTLFASLPERLPADARVLDLGCGPGHWTLELAQRYSGACCMGLDLSLEMLREAARQTSELASGSPERPHWLRADAERLPLADASLDLVFSSLAVQWCDSPRLWL